MIGVPGKDARKIASLIGVKTFVSDMVAYGSK